MRKHLWAVAGLLSLCGTVGAQNLPTRKPGLWALTVMDIGEHAGAARPATVKQCTSRVDDAQLLLSVAPGQENCEQPKVRRTREGYRIDTACSVHDVPVRSRFELSGNLQQRYEGHYEVQYGPQGSPGSRPRVEARRFAGQWLGACPADMKPGDLVLPNGVKVNGLARTPDGPPPPQGAHGHDHAHDHPHGRR